MLCIIKTGAAYLPLDPQLPEARVQQILKDADVELLLTDTVALSQASKFYPATDIELTIAPNDPLYVLYTSGSTGEPKGAIITHGAELNLMSWYRDEYQINAADQILVISSTSFDLTQKNFFAALTCGACLHFVPMQGFDADKIITTLQNSEITLLNCAPSAFYTVLAVSLDYQPFASLRYLLLGGEPIAINRLYDWLSNEQCQTQLVNMYGPTECTDIATAFTVTDKTQLKFYLDNPLPLGKASGGVELYIVDAEQKQLPAGLIGELCIGGAGVGLGYLNLPQKTAQVFIDNPFGEGKIYRSGDLVYLNEQQQLIFVARQDHQVKHRGYRIELNAISTYLCQHPDVVDAACVLQSQQLVAFYQGASHLSSDTLNQFVAAQLPHYMVPERWQQLDIMPLNKNGKLDLKQLTLTADAPSIRKTAPHTAIQRRLAAIWCQLLTLTEVSAEDDFFRLGGHSLLATQLVSRIRAETALDIPLTLVFEHSQLDTMAAALERLTTYAQTPLTKVANKTHHPLSYAQQRLWFVQNLTPESSSYNMSSFLRLKGEVNTTALDQALIELVKRHSTLRTRFVSQDETPYQQVEPVPEKLLNCHIFDTNQSALTLAQTQAAIPFDLSTDLMLRADLFSHTQEHLLALTLHHIAADGWSMSILIKELAHLYQALSTQAPIQLATLPIQYTDYAHWQHQQLAGSRLKVLSRYWQQQLAGMPTVAALPLDHPRPAIATQRGGRVNCQLPKPALKKLNSLASQHRCTPFMAMLAIFDLVLHQTTGATDIVVGTDLANRPQPQLEKLIGFFVNLLPTRLDYSGNPSFIELLARSRHMCLGLYQHQDMPFDKLVEQINPTRSQSVHPLVQVLFVLQNTPQSSLQAGDLNIAVIKPEQQQSRFDLALFINDNAAGHWVYNRDLFKQSTVEKLNSQFNEVLEQVVSQPQCPINRLPSAPGRPSISNQQRRSRIAGLKKA